MGHGASKLELLTDRVTALRRQRQYEDNPPVPVRGPSGPGGQPGTHLPRPMALAVSPAAGGPGR